MQQVQLRVGGSEQGGRIACKAWLGVGAGRGEFHQRGLVGAGGQNGFDGAVVRAVMGQSPVFGIIKQVMGWRQMSMRGLDKARGKWTLVTIEWNIMRLHVLLAA